MVLRSARGAALAGAGVAFLGAAAWSASRKAWKHVLPYAKRAGTYLAGAWSELLLKGKRSKEEDKLRDGFEPGKSGGKTVGEVARRMSGASRQRVQYAAQLLAQEIAAYNEEGMLAYVDGIDVIPEALEYVAGGIAALAVSALQEQPLDPRVGEFINGGASGIGNVANAMSQLRALIESVHEYELRKLRENARPNDHKWDHSHNAR
ncbi:hypothetical protein ABZ799_01065 [Nocardiopsis dassonvillei]|uniref:hypothetical protein n=1 Tax=Nocardiopsis dassonvillei TaxID=2014 RepID=UPI0033D3B12F